MNKSFELIGIGGIRYDEFGVIIGVIERGRFIGETIYMEFVSRNRVLVRVGSEEVRSFIVGSGKCGIVSFVSDIDRLISS